VTVTRTGTLDYRCMRGWSRNVFECERSVPHTRYDEPTLTPTCTTGTPTGGRCYTHQLPTKTCDNSDIAESERWELVGDVCKRTLTHTPTCPAGFPDLRGGLCRPTPPTTTPTTTPPTTTPPTTAVPPSTPTTRAARPPGAPESLRLEAGDRQFTASWQPPADNGGSPVTGYTVRYKMGLLGVPQDVTTAVDALDRQPDGTLSRVIAGLTNDASYVVWVGAANPAGTTWTGAHAVTLPEVPRVRISGLDGAARIGKGTLADDFAVTPADATCTARITNPPPGGPPPTGAPAPTAELAPDTGASRTVTVTANTPGPVTVQITCVHTGHNAAESAVFDFASPDGCDLSFTWATKATIHQSEWSTSCTSKKRNPGNSQTPYYAKRYTFTLPTAATVAVDLNSRQNTYLYLWGTGDDGTKVDLHNDNIDTTNRDSRLSVRLQPGTYTIEATTAAPRATGDFTLIIAPAGPLAAAYHATVGEPWAAAFESPATPSRHTVTPPDGLDLALTHSNNTATVTGTPQLAGTYNATFESTSRLGTAHSTITITVTCPIDHIQRSDRTCREALGPGLEALLVPGSHWEQGQTTYQVSQAALRGMVNAANDFTNVNALKNFNTGCAVIHPDYRLTRELLVALLVSIQFHELFNPSSEPNSLMDLSRGDYYHEDVAWRLKNRNLYSLKTVDGDPRAFWHPGVGLWQLDDASTYGSNLNHAQRAHATTAASAAAEIIHHNYCYGKTRLTEQQSINRLKTSLYKAAWNACEPTTDAANGVCYKTFRSIVKGEEFPDPQNTRSPQPYDGRLQYLNVHTKLTDPHGGAVESLRCTWTGGTRSTQPFPCFKFDDISHDDCDSGITNCLNPAVQGYVHLYGGITGYFGFNSKGKPSGRSPLAFPFLSFTNESTSPHMKYIVFKADTNDDGVITGYDRDLIAGVPLGWDVRNVPAQESGYIGLYDREDGWWHEHSVDGSTVVMVE